MVRKSDGVQQTRALAATHCKKAIQAILKFDPSPARNTLIQLIGKILERNK